MLAESNHPEERISSPTYARVLPLGDHLTPNVQDDERSSWTISCCTTKTVLAEDTLSQHVFSFNISIFFCFLRDRRKNVYKKAN